MQGIRSEEEDGSAEGEERNENVEGLPNNLSIETGATDEEAAEGLDAALRMDIDGDGEVEGKEL